MQCIFGRLLVGLVLLSATSWLRATDPPKKDPVNEEFDRISGKWRLTKFNVQGIEFPDHILKPVVVSITDRKWLTKPCPATYFDKLSGRDVFVYGNDFEAKMTIDPSAKPATVDLEIVHLRQIMVLKGIYKLDADKLTICHSLTKERPTEFKATSISETRLLVLVREKK